MAKGSRQSGRMVNKHTGGAKARKVEYPLSTVESNETADKQAYLLHYGILGLGVVVAIALLVWGGWELYHGLQTKPISWIDIAWGVTAIASILFAIRGLFWLSIISPVMLAAKGRGWKSQDEICRKALKFPKLVPGGGLTVTNMLIQSLMSRGGFDEAIVLGEEQCKLYENNPKMLEGMGPVCGAVGLAYQVKGDNRQSITWSEKAIEAYEKSIDIHTATKKSWMTKLSETQGGDYVGTYRTQMTISYFTNAKSYFEMQNMRKAKHNFYKAQETANLSPDFPDKAELVKVCREQLSRLKHV